MPTQPKVRFGEVQAQVFHLDEDQTDVSALWYSSEDFLAFREQSKANESDRLALSRGNARRRNHIQSILVLQQDHRDNDIQDTKGLSALSLALSKDSKKEAQLQAGKDCLEVFQVHAKNSFFPTQATSGEEYAKKTRPRLTVTRRGKFPSCA